MGSSVERMSDSGQSMNERFYTAKSYNVRGKHCSTPMHFNHLPLIEERNRDTPPHKENILSKEDNLQSNGQSTSSDDTSSLLNNSSGSVSSYQSVEDKTALRTALGSHGDNISCISGVDNAIILAERENGSNGATSADKTPSVDKVVDNKESSPKGDASFCIEEKVVTSYEPLGVEGAKTIGTDEQNKQLSAPLEQRGSEAPPLPSQLANTNGASTTIEDEVRVCDICGDLGREYMLAICSKCSDGAEHIYCMRVQMDKVPEGDWLCEDCETKQIKVDTSKKTLMTSLSMKDAMPQTFVSSSTMKRQPSTVVSSTNNSSKRSLEAYAESPKGSSPKRRLVKPFVRIGSLGNNVTSNSKSRLLKSKLFNIMDLKPKDRLSRQDSGKMPMTESSAKDGREKIFHKSMSFSNARTDTEKEKKMMSSGSSVPVGARQTREPNPSKKISAFMSGLSNLSVSKKTTAYAQFVSPASVSIRHDQVGPLSCRLPRKGSVPGIPLRRALSVKTESCLKPDGLDTDTPSGSHCLINLPRVLSKPSPETVIPQIDCDWRGSLEVGSGGGFCTRIQAHRSTRASVDVLDLVRKLPLKIVLEEQPRGSIWPTTQFIEKNYPTQDNIALFFFAEDLKSYDNYKSMLKRMIDNDFALRGHVDGSELLIFSSTVLPKNSQRWNNLLFMWGLFRHNKLCFQNRVDVPESSAACSDPCLSVNTEPSVEGINHLHRNISDPPELFSEAKQHCGTSKVPESRGLEQKVLVGENETRDHDINEERRPSKRMKSPLVGTPPVRTQGFYFEDFSSNNISSRMGSTLAVDLELSLGTKVNEEAAAAAAQKRKAALSLRFEDDEEAAVSLSLSLAPPSR